MPHTANDRADPRLVFFQYKYRESMSEMVRFNRNQQTKCLSLFFDVIVVQEDCNFQDICDRYDPDLALFEMQSGAESDTSRRPEVSGLRRVTHIPKLGFFNADAFCEARAGFISDMENFNFDAAFSICTTAAEHNPSLADKLFTWPNFVDPDVFMDYGSQKNISVLITGSQSTLYPWRRQITGLIADYYPSLTVPHRGYRTKYGNSQMPVGDHYARLINSSWFAPSCGTVAKEVVRKLFEIPACRTCLITERSAGIEAAGFIDMENCVFADQSNILEKIDYLFSNPEILERITDAGHKLVRARHTMKQRNQIRQWYELNARLSPDQKIVQGNPFEPLTVLERSKAVSPTHLRARGAHLECLRKGDLKLVECKYEQAERLYLACLNYIPWMPEPALKLAICSLHKGDPRRAISLLSSPIAYILNSYGAVDPDPIEWAYFIVAHVCLGNLNDAADYADQFPWIKHPELDRARWVGRALGGRTPTVPTQGAMTAKFRISIHQLPSRSFSEWAKQAILMLAAAGRGDLADILATRATDEETRALRDEREPFLSARNAETTDTFGAGDGPRPTPSSVKMAFGTTSESLIYRAQSGLRRTIKKYLHCMEAKYGYFLPYHLSAMQNDELFRIIKTLAETEELDTSLIIGAVRGQPCTEALLAGAFANPRETSVVCLSAQENQVAKLGQAFKNSSRVRCLGVLDAIHDESSKELLNGVVGFSLDGVNTNFDAILIDGINLGNTSSLWDKLSNYMTSAKFVILTQTNTEKSFSILQTLLADQTYRLLAHNPLLRNGYAIFRKVGFSGAEDDSSKRVPAFANGRFTAEHLHRSI